MTALRRGVRALLRRLLRIESASVVTQRQLLANAREFRARFEEGYRQGEQQWRRAQPSSYEEWATSLLEVDSR